MRGCSHSTHGDSRFGVFDLQLVDVLALYPKKTTRIAIALTSTRLMHDYQRDTSEIDGRNQTRS